MSSDEQQQDEQQQDEQQQDEQQQDEQQQDEQQQDEQQQDEQQQDQESFGRSYVEKLRKESARYRTAANEAEEQLDTVMRLLHAEKVKATGLLVEPGELQYSAAHLESNEALTAAVEELLERKPYLRRRTVAGNIGQHQDQQQASFSLADTLRSNAG